MINIPIADIDRELFYREHEAPRPGFPASIKYTFKNVRISVIPKLLPILEDLNQNKHDIEYELLEGGRGGGKSEPIGQALVLIARTEKTRILCTREIQNSLKDSNKKVIEEWIDKLGFKSEFHITLESVVHKKTGTDFIFMGLKTGTDNDSMKSLKGVKYVWVEEAQTLSSDSWGKLNPTIRVNGRVFFFTYNPRSEKDTVNEIKNLRKARLTRLNYTDNPFLPEVLRDQALELKELDYDQYIHVWEGVPMAEDASSIILPYSWLSQCIDLHKQHGFSSGQMFAGFDIADGTTDSHDKNAFATRSGACLHFVDEWRTGEVYQSVSKIHQYYYQFGFSEINFDATALGVAAKSEFARIEAEEKKKLPYDVVPFQGGMSPRGNDTVFVRHAANTITNGQYFKNLKSQSWWNIRMRLENSIKLIKGHKIDRDGYYLSFSSDIKDLDGLFSELSQATYKIDSGGRVQVDKCPGIKMIRVDGKQKEKRSPNRADAVVYSIAHDLKFGLRAHGSEQIVSKKTTSLKPNQFSW